MNSEAIVKKVQLAWEQNYAVRMPGTPFIVVNGMPYNGRNDSANLSATINMILMERIQFNDCPPMSIAPNKQYVAVLHTEKVISALNSLPIKPRWLSIASFFWPARVGSTV